MRRVLSGRKVHDKQIIHCKGECDGKNTSFIPLNVLLLAPQGGDKTRARPSCFTSLRGGSRAPLRDYARFRAISRNAL